MWGLSFHHCPLFIVSGSDGATCSWWGYFFWQLTTPSPEQVLLTDWQMGDHEFYVFHAREVVKTRTWHFQFLLEVSVSHQDSESQAFSMCWKRDQLCGSQKTNAHEDSCSQTLMTVRIGRKCQTHLLNSISMKRSPSECYGGQSHSPAWIFKWWGTLHTARFWSPAMLAREIFLGFSLHGIIFLLVSSPYSLSSSRWIVVAEVPAFGMVFGQDYNISTWAGKCRGYFITLTWAGVGSFM